MSGRSAGHPASFNYSADAGAGYEGRFGDLVEQHAGGIKATLPF
jgi:hypothetical protein